MFLAGQAAADDRTISSTITDPVETVDPAGNGGTPGNITITSDGKINLTSAGASVTLNSDNTVTNNGAITNTVNDGGIGVHILGGFTGNLLDDDGRPIGLTGAGDITVVPTDTDPTLWGKNIAVLIDGAGTFTGDIDLHAMDVTAIGHGGAGVEVDTNLDGNMLFGNVTAVGEGSSAVRTTAAINGMMSFSQQVTARGAQSMSATDLDPWSGAAVAIGGDVTGGILNIGPATTDDTTTIQSQIRVAGGSPAVLISPDVAGSGAPDLTIGVLDDETNPGFSFLNRGLIDSTGADPGVSATTILIGRTDTSETHTATLTGGIYNIGIIASTATSANAAATNVDVTTTDTSADATTIRIAAGGNVPSIVNDTGGQITATTGGGPWGGTATAIMVDEGGSLTSIVNNGTISAFAGTQAAADGHIPTLVAVAIWDKSGSVTSVVNTGIIKATTNITNAGTTVDNQTVLLGDFSANTTTLSFTNAGILEGDIVFGAGTSTFVIDGDTASTKGSYHAAAGGVLDIDVANGTFSTGDTVGHNLDVGDKGVVSLAVTGTGGTTPAITLSGDSHFIAGAKLAVTYGQLVGDHASFALMHADGSISFDDVDAATEGSKPFLYNVNFANDGHDLTLELDRKSASDLGFTGNIATLYEPAIEAVVVSGDTALGSALMGLSGAEDTAVAFESLMPVVNGAQRNYAISLTDQWFGPVGARQRALVMSPNQGHNLAFWGQEFWLSNQNDGSSSMPGYSDSGFGVAAGADYGSLSTGRYGLAFEHFNGDSVEGTPRVTKVVNNWTVFSAYAQWADVDSGLFLNTDASFGFGSFDQTRRIMVDEFQTTAKGHWSGWLTAWGLSVGDVIGDETFAIIPQANLDALYMSESGYDERGADAANLHVDGRSSTSIRGFLGLVGRAQFEFAGGYVRPELHIGWSHEFAGHPADANVYFISAQNMHFRISGPAEPVSKFIGGGSLSFVYNNWSVGGDYDRTLGSNTDSEAGSLTVTGHF